MARIAEKIQGKNNLSQDRKKARTPLLKLQFLNF